MANTTKLYEPQVDGWALKVPTVALTAQEAEWYDWAASGAEDVLTDEGWLADNDDALMVTGQLDDMRYRLEEQGPDVAEDDANSEQRVAGRCRVLASLVRKLEASGWFTEEYHA